MSQIITPPLAPPPEPAVMQMKGSPITAAANSVQLRTNEQSATVQTLGGKMSGGAAVEVKNIPQVPSAGNSNPTGVFVGMQELKAVASEQGKYDSLGSAPAMSVGGSRRKRRTGKHNKHGRKISKHTRKHRGAFRKHSSIHHSSRKLHSRRGKKTYKK